MPLVPTHPATVSVAPVESPDADLIFDVLADRTRREILRALRQERSMSVGSIAALFPFLSRTAVSTKLAQLRRAGLVEEERRGTFRLYSLAASRPGDVVSFVVDVWGTRPRRDELAR